MNFLEMISEIKGSRIMLEYDGNCYTYGCIIDMARKEAAGWGNNKTVKIRVIKKSRLINQLVDFFACYFCGFIPLVVAYDGGYYEDGQNIELSEAQTFSLKNISYEKPCVAVSTSGTTGKPKIYLRTYESWAEYFDKQNKIFCIDADTRMFCHGSLAFTGNLNLYLGTFYVGGRIIASDKLIPAKWIEDISRANMIYLIPSKLMLLTRWCGKVIYTDIRMIISGSQSLGKQDAEKLKELFPNTKILLYYGASELNYITYVMDGDMTNEKNLIGRPFPDVEVWVKNQQIFVDTKYHVIGINCPYTLADTGYMDDEGRLYFTGRSDDIINIRGRKISVIKVENELLECDLVAEAAVKLDENFGITAWVVITPCEKMLENKLNDIKSAIRTFISSRNILAPYERPKRINIVDTLPKTDSGKVDKSRLSY